MVRHFGKNTTWMKWFSGKFITRGMLWWVVPLLVTLSSITWLRWGHNSFRMTTLILLPTANLLSEAQHFFVGPPYPLGPHMWMQRAGCELSISNLVWERVLEPILCGYQRTTVVLFTLRMHSRWGFAVWMLCSEITWTGFSLCGCVVTLNTNRSRWSCVLQFLFSSFLIFLFFEQATWFINHNYKHMWSLRNFTAIPSSFHSVHTHSHTWYFTSILGLSFCFPRYNNKQIETYSLFPSFISKR